MQLPQWVLISCHQLGVWSVIQALPHRDESRVPENSVSPAPDCYHGGRAFIPADLHAPGLWATAQPLGLWFQVAGGGGGYGGWLRWADREASQFDLLEEGK